MEPARPGGTSFRRYAIATRAASASSVRRRFAGFTLGEIAELLALGATDDRNRARYLARLRIAALDASIVEMMSARQALVRLADECGFGSAGPRPILT